jgi:hypothetical protein
VLLASVTGVPGALRWARQDRAQLAADGGTDGGQAGGGQAGGGQAGGDAVAQG